MNNATLLKINLHEIVWVVAGNMLELDKDKYAAMILDLPSNTAFDKDEKIPEHFQCIQAIQQKCSQVPF